MHWTMATVGRKSHLDQFDPTDKLILTLLEELVEETPLSNINRACTNSNLDITHIGRI